MKKRNVLFVDDEASVLRSLKRLFRREPINILTASGGLEALDILENTATQVVVSDQRMTGLSGTEFLSRVREAYPNTVRCILSGYAETHAILGAINEGHVYRFIAKPWDDEQLIQTIHECLDEHDARAQRALLSLSRDVLESVPVAIAAVDANDCMIYTNRMFAETFQSIPGSLPGQSVGDPWRVAVSCKDVGANGMGTIDLHIQQRSHAANVSRVKIGGCPYTLIAVANSGSGTRRSP